MESFLTQEQVLVLRVAHKQQKEKRLADRIKAVLSLNSGHPIAQIASILLIDDATIYRWVQKFQESGTKGLLEMNYHGGKSRLSLVQETEIKKHFQDKTALTISAVVNYVQLNYRIKYSIIGATKLMHRLGFSYKKPKIVPGKADQVKQQEFLNEYLKIKNKLGSIDQIYFVDSTHPSHNTQLAYGWILKGKANDKFVKTTNGRQRLNLCGAMSLNHKSITVLDEKTINKESIIRLLEEIKGKQKHGKVYFVLDNASYHHAKIVRGWIMHHPRFKLIFLPPYSPNLNLIERLWKFFHQHITYNHYFDTFEEFKNTSLNFFNNLKNYDQELSTLLTDNFRLTPEANYQT